MMGLRGWLTGERDTQHDLPKKNGPEGVLGDGREEKGRGILDQTTKKEDMRP